MSGVHRARHVCLCACYACRGEGTRHATQEECADGDKAFVVAPGVVRVSRGSSSRFVANPVFFFFIPVPISTRNQHEADTQAHTRTCACGWPGIHSVE